MIQIDDGVMRCGDGAMRSMMMIRSNDNGAIRSNDDDDTIERRWCDDDDAMRYDR